MNYKVFPVQITLSLLEDAIQRALMTARRAAHAQILWRERGQTRATLVHRVEYQLGRGCFGGAAWEDTFYRDLRAVRQAFQCAGFTLEYRRSTKEKGYYLRGQPDLLPEFSRMILASAAEVDHRQMAIYRRLSPAERFRQGCEISDTARRVVAYRIRKENPSLTVDEANRQALERSYTIP